MTYEEYHSTEQRIETDRLILRRLTMDDDEAIYAYCKDPEVTRYVVFPTHESIDDSREFLRKAIGFYERNEPSVSGIVLKESNVLIGTIGVHNWSRDHKRTEVGYALAREQWNHGYVTEALQGLIAHLFAYTDLVRIEALCKEQNVGSARVMEKAGMSFEGLLRQYTFSKGEFHDMNMYSIVREEISNLKS